MKTSLGVTSSKPQSLARLLTLQIVGLAFLTLIGIVTILFLSFVITVQQVQRKMDTVAANASQQFAEFFLELESLLLAKSNGTPTENLTQIMALNPAILNLGLVDSEGHITSQVYFSNGAVLSQFPQPDWLTTPPRFGEALVSSVSFEEDHPIVDIGVLATDDIGLSVGILWARIDLTLLWNAVIDVEVGTTGYNYIVDNKNLIVAYRNHNLVGQLQSESLSSDNIAPAIAQTGVRFYSGLGGELVLAYVHPLGDILPWFTVVEQPAREALQPFYLTAFGLLGVSVAVGLILINAVNFNQRRIIRPLGALTQGVKNLSRGEVKDLVPVKYNDELGQLAHAFNTMATQLHDLLSTLEQRVLDRTHDLQVSAELSQQVTTVLDEKELLSHIVSLTQASFNFYHVSIFRFTPSSQKLSLVAASSEAAAQMLKDGHEFHLSDRALVPLAGNRQTAALSNDVLVSTEHKRNPLLPETRAEMALPIIFGGELIGVLDLQSTKENRFSEQDKALFASFANQLAVAIRNAGLFREVLEAREHAEQADRAKSAFLANMSHELRTPLNAIINFSKFLRKQIPGPMNEEQIQLVTHIAESGEHLLQLINDVLDMSKIEAGSLKLFVEEKLNMVEIIQAAVRYTTPMLADKPVQLMTFIPDSLPLMTGDRKRLLQIILNVLSNACKFTDEGSITVSAKPMETHLLISIEDTGPGIAAEDSEFVFEPFKQTESGLRQGGGTGLGMPISRKLAEAHGGDLWFESCVGKGTLFFVKLPFDYF